jgi:hypothetical protein
VAPGPSARYNVLMKQRRSLLCTLIAASLTLTMPGFQALAQSSPVPGAPPIIGPGVNHPERQWKTFETPHFRVHYYQGFEGFARYAAEIAESGYERIAADLVVPHQEQIHLVINEDEFWNGFAEPLRNRIVLDPRFSLEPTIGLPRFILHEMTHILNFEAVQTELPFSRLVHAAGLPAWFAEGLAQYEAEFWAPEMDRLLRLHTLNRTLLTPAERNAFILLGNRGADGYNEGYAIVKFLFDTYGHDRLPVLLRTYREQNVSFDQALQLTFGKPFEVLEAEWRQSLELNYREQLQHRTENLPGAQSLTAYKQGQTWYQPQVSPDGKWLAYLSTGGYSTIRGHIYNIMPLKVTALDRFEAWGQQQQAKQTKDNPKDPIKPQPTPEPTDPPELEQPGTPPEPSPLPDTDQPNPESSPFPVPLPPGSVQLNPSQLKSARLTQADPEPVLQTEQPAEPAPQPELKLEDFEATLVPRLLDYRWRPDSQALAYTTLKPDAYGNSTSRVQLLKLKTNGSKLDNDGDAIELDPSHTTHSPSWSPDGKTLAVVLEEEGHDSIAFYDTTTRQLSKRVLKAPDWRQYRWLQFSPDGNQLLMEVFLPGIGQHLLRYHLGTGMVEQLTDPEPREADRQPIWGPDGKDLYFVSTRSGFADLWRYEPQSRQIERLSQIWSGLETPSLSPDGKSLYYARHHAEGTTLDRIALDKLKIFDQFSHGSGEAIFEQSASLNPTPKLLFEPKDYMPWFGLEVVVPVIGRDEKGDQIGVLAQFSDLLQRHAFNLLFLYGLASSRIGYNAAYVNRFFDTSFGVEVGDSPVLSFTTDGSQFFIQRDQHVSLFANRPLFNAGSGDTFATNVERFASLEFTVSRQTNLTSQLDGVITPQQLREGFNNTLAFSFTDDRSVRKQRGFRYSLGVTGASRFFGSQYEHISANAEWRHYIPTWAQQTFAYFVTAQAMQGETRPGLLGGPPLSNVLVLNFQNIIPLRGFRIAELQGPMMVAGSMEYRVPLLNPIVAHFEDHYIENVHAAAFMDIGDAWFPSKRTAFPHIGVGLELRSEIILSRRNSFQLYVGAGKALLGAGQNYLTDRPVEFYGGFANVF